jgi:phenol 2-monooxygenase
MTPPASQSAPVCVDVLVVGGGPVGLLVAYQLARSGLSVHVVDKDDKKSKLQSQGQGQGQGQHYGRANAIYSRSAELLDQLGLADDILQQCHVCREAYTYDERGERVVPGRVWNFIENIDDTV